MFTTVALGSNLGDRAQNLRTAVKYLRDLAQKAAPFVTSRVYETDPIDCPAGSPGFLNAVVGFDFDAPPLALLTKLQHIEANMGRALTSERETNSPRPIDLDILHFGEMQITSDSLIVPHPRLHLRRFVLTPLADIAPDLHLPGHNATVSQLLASIDDPSPAIPTADSL